jgi:hypothetical protein
VTFPPPVEPDPSGDPVYPQYPHAPQQPYAGPNPYAPHYPGPYPPVWGPPGYPPPPWAPGPPEPPKRTVAWLGWVVAASGLFILITTLLPWFHVVLPPVEGAAAVHVADTHGNALVAAFGAIVLVMGVVIGVGRGYAWTSIFALAASALVPFFVLLNMAGRRLVGAFDLPDAPDFHIAYGYWLALAAGIVGLAAAIVALTMREPVADTSDQPRRSTL